MEAGVTGHELGEHAAQAHRELGCLGAARHLGHRLDAGGPVRRRLHERAQGHAPGRVDHEHHAARAPIGALLDAGEAVPWPARPPQGPLWGEARIEPAS